MIKTLRAIGFGIREASEGLKSWKGTTHHASSCFSVFMPVKPTNLCVLRPNALIVRGLIVMQCANAVIGAVHFGIIVRSKTRKDRWNREPVNWRIQKPVTQR